MEAKRRSTLFLLTLAVAGCGGIVVEPGSDAGDLDGAMIADAAHDEDGGVPIVPDAGPECAAGETSCGGECVELDVDPRHCGACDVDCDALEGVTPGAATCAAGECVIEGACAAGFSDCNGDASDGCEADLASVTDCGACGNDCGALPGVAPDAAACVAGACEIAGACAPGFGDCNGDASDGCEVDLSTASDCGACGNACVSGVEVCSADGAGVFACETSCGGATPDRCGDACVDLASDPTSCGACGAVCPGAPFGTAVCDAGACELACDAGYHVCGDACAEDASVASCGASCSPCPVPANASATCDGTACGYACLPGFADCDGSAANGCESDLSAPSSCGACANDCTALPGVSSSAVRCTAGACDVTGACAPGRADCAGGAADGCESDLSSSSSCGACGVACDAATETCEPASGGGYVCTNGCDASAPARCGAACVDLDSDPAHCGACGASCASPSGGSATCTAGACGFVCDASHHACGDACLPNDDPASCGSSCTPCAAPANATATCEAGTCGFVCVPGFADCDGDPANGCELSLSDPLGGVIFCDGFEAGLGAWNAESMWQATMTPYRGVYSLRGYWGGSFSTGCGITRSIYLRNDLDLSEVTSATLEFRHTAVVGSSDTLRVLVSTDGGASWSTINTPGSSGSWTLRTLDLSSYAGEPDVRIGFRFTNNCGDSDGVTWRVDDVAVHVTR